MSYVLAVIVREGIVALADTRVTVGPEKRFDEKIWVDPRPDPRFFALFAGNRFWTDEVLHALADDPSWHESATVAAFADWLGLRLLEIRKRRSYLLEDIGTTLSFDIGLIVGGTEQREQQDGMSPSRQDIRLVYQAGNHVSYSEFTPYHFSGMTSYGKFILEDGVYYRSFATEGFGDESSLQQAVSAALLSLHAVQSSVCSVDYPIHLLVWPIGDRLRKLFLRQSDLLEFRETWRAHLGKFLSEAPLPPGLTL